MLVMKFGGTSVGDGPRIKNVAGIVLRQRERQPVVVTSAMTGVTDALLRLHSLASTGDEAFREQLEALCQRHRDTAQMIDAATDWSYLEDRLQDLQSDVLRVFDTQDGSLRARDCIASWGEKLAVILVTGAIDSAGGKGGCWDGPMIVTDSHFGEATPRPTKTRELAKNALAEATANDAILVSPGFIGLAEASDDQHEIITTLGRGGSDYSATLIAVALEADACWIYTDVDGVFTADPRIVRKARVLPLISYETAGRLAMCGAKVLHPRSVSPAKRRGIELRVCNTFKPDFPGTLIARASAETHGCPQVVAGRRKLCAVGLQGAGLAEIPNLFGRLCRAIADTGSELVLAAHPVPGHDPQIVIEEGQATVAVEAIAKEFATEITNGQASNTAVTEHLAICTLVGDDLGRLIVEQSQRALASEHVTPLAQSAAADALVFVVPEAALDQVIRRIHQDVIEPALREAAQRGVRPYSNGQWAAGGKAQRRRSTLPQH
jgi:aspartate kinase